MEKNNRFHIGSYYLTDNNYIVKIITDPNEQLEFHGLVIGQLNYDFAYIKNIEHNTAKDELDKFIEKSKQKVAFPILTYTQNGDAKGMLTYKLMKLVGWRAH